MAKCCQILLKIFSVAAQNLIQLIQLKREHLRKSECKVADLVLADPQAVIRMRIVDVANEAQVSEPTVVRFCRALDIGGFQEFKLSLAQQLSSPATHFGKVAVNADDSVGTITRKLFDTTIETLIDVRDHLDESAMAAAIYAVAQASRVEFFGFGASGAVGVDAQHKFFRLRVATSACSDHHVQHMSAMSMSPGDVVLAISQSGRTKALLSSMQLAKDKGATVIAIAPSRSAVADAATIHIAVDVDEDLDVHTPLTSRIAHLTVIDILALGVAQYKGEDLQEHLYLLKRSLSDLRL